MSKMYTFVVFFASILSFVCGSTNESTSKAKRQAPYESVNSGFPFWLNPNYGYYNDTHYPDYNPDPTYFDYQDSESAEESLNPNAWELGDNFEGDIVLDDLPEGGKGVINLRWPDSTIYYQFLGRKWDEWTGYEKGKFNAALENIFDRTCVRLINCWSFCSIIARNWIGIRTYGDGMCSSRAGRNPKPGVQILNLGEGCFYKRTIIHELMHAFGFIHEQNRPDRDNYVTIHWDRIREGWEYNFERRDRADTYGHSYDHRSVMHYSRTAFSIDGRNTMDYIGCPSCTDEFGIGDGNGGVTLTDAYQIRTRFMCPE